MELSYGTALAVLAIYVAVGGLVFLAIVTVISRYIARIVGAGQRVAKTAVSYGSDYQIPGNIKGQASVWADKAKKAAAALRPQPLSKSSEIAGQQVLFEDKIDFSSEQDNNDDPIYPYVYDEADSMDRPDEEDEDSDKVIDEENLLLFGDDSEDDEDLL